MVRRHDWMKKYGKTPKFTGKIETPQGALKNAFSEIRASILTSFRPSTEEVIGDLMEGLNHAIRFDAKGKEAFKEWSEEFEFESENDIADQNSVLSAIKKIHQILQTEKGYKDRYLDAFNLLREIENKIDEFRRQIKLENELRVLRANAETHGKVLDRLLHQAKGLESKSAKHKDDMVEKMKVVAAIKSENQQLRSENQQLKALLSQYRVPLPSLQVETKQEQDKKPHTEQVGQSPILHGHGRETRERFIRKPRDKDKRKPG